MREMIAALLFALSAAVATPARSDSALPDSSLYQLRSSWLDDAGHSLRLEQLRGKARIITLFFANCESSCPMVVGNLKLMEAALPKGWEAWGGIVLVTLDPARDDTGSLAAYRKHMSLDAARWTLLRGRESDTRALAMALGVAYRPSQANGGMVHDAVIVILDAQGRIRGRIEGAPSGSELARAFREAAGR